MKKVCLCCKEKIFGRSDKKFCSDGCRNAYHNAVKNESLKILRNTNNKLRKNYRILDQVVLNQGKGRVNKTKLIDQGFFFDLFTSIYHTKKGTSYFFVYDLGYLKVSENLYIVVKKYETLPA